MTDGLRPECHTGLSLWLSEPESLEAGQVNVEAGNEPRFHVALHILCYDRGSGSLGASTRSPQDLTGALTQREFRSMCGPKFHQVQDDPQSPRKKWRVKRIRVVV